MPMPPSGAARPSFSVSNRAPASPPTFRPSITLPTEPTVSIRPQKVPSRPEEHQQAGHVAGDVARLVEPGGDGIQQMPHGLLRDRHPPGALAAEDRRHRRQQRRVPIDRKPGIGDAEIVDPGDFRIEPDHLAERQDDADQEHQADQRVEAGIGEEGRDDLLVEHDHDQRAQHQEHQHPHQENPRRGQFGEFDLHRGAGRGAGGHCDHPLRGTGFQAPIWHSGGGEKSRLAGDLRRKRNFGVKPGFGLLRI